MKFYRLHNSAGPEVGFVPQVVNGIYPGKYDSPNALGMPGRKRADSNTEIPGGIIHKRAKLTDVMSVAFLSGELFVSPRLADIILESKCEGVQFVGTELVLKNGDKVMYTILHPYLDKYSCLDTDKSEFFLFDSGVRTALQRVYFENTAAYISASIENQNLAPLIGYQQFKPLVINHIGLREDCEIDFFSLFGLRHGGVGYFVSERLKHIINNRKCTGLIFTEMNEVYP